MRRYFQRHHRSVRTLAGFAALTTGLNFFIACNSINLSALTGQQEEDALPDSVLLAGLLNATLGSASRTASVAFKALDSNSSAFNCGSTFFVDTTTGGSGTMTPIDLRFFVSEVKLIDWNGTTSSAPLTSDGVWQAYGAGLLDFENSTGLCANSSPNTNTTLRMNAPIGSWQGIEFTLGLPYELNKTDNSGSATSSPFNSTGMYWSWTSGYKFTKIEWNGHAGNKVNWHIGSTGCTGIQSADCAKPYRSTVRLTHADGFNPIADTLVFDWETALSNFPRDTGATKFCMPGDADADCQKLLTNVGLATTGAATGAAAAFRIQKGR